MALGAVAACWLFAPAAFAGSGPTIQVPLLAGAPTIDGVQGAPEWNGAAVIGVNFGSVSGTLYVGRDASNIYVAVKANDPSATAPASALYFDNNDDGTRAVGDDLWDIPNGGVGRDWFISAASPSSFSSSEDIQAGGTNDTTGAASYSGGVYFAEYKHPICSSDTTHDICVAIPGQVGIDIVYGGTAPTGTGWPSGLFNVDQWANLSLTSPPPVPTVNVNNADGHEFEKLLSNGAYLIYYNKNLGGSFQLSVPQNDDAAGIVSASFPSTLFDAIQTSQPAAGWTSGDPADTPRDKTYQFASGAAQPTSFDVTSTDANHLTSPPRTVGFQPDSLGPTGGYSCQPVTCSDPNGPVRVTVHVTDNGGSGVAQVMYRTDGGAALDGGTPIANGGSFFVTSGAQVALGAIDNVGNPTATVASGPVNGRPAPSPLVWNYAEDFQADSNPGPDRYGNPGVWSYGEVPIATQHDMSTATVYPTFGTPPGSTERCWHTANPDSDGLSPDACVILNGNPIPDSDIDPATTRDTYVQWKSPISGVVSISGGFTDEDPGAGDGVNWFVDKNGATLAQGAFPNGGASQFPSSLSHVAVSAGDSLTFLVGPGPVGDFSYDSTRADITITQVPPTPPPSVLSNGGFEQALLTSQTGGAVGLASGNWLPYSGINNNGPAPGQSAAHVEAGLFSGHVATTTNAGGGNQSELWQDAPATFDPNQGFMLHAWVYPVVGQTQVYALFDSDRNAGNQAGSAGILINGSGTSFGAWGQSASLPALTFNTWHELLLVADPANHTSELWLDGVPHDITTPGSAIPLNPSFSLPHTSVVLGATCGSCADLNEAYYDQVTLSPLVAAPSSSDPPQTGPNYVVNTADDHADSAGCTQGDCSLREAILAANAADVAATIHFAIGAGGPQTITLKSPLPVVQTTVELDGGTQPGGIPGQPPITLDGSQLPPSDTRFSGIVLNGAGSVLHGFAIESFTGNGVVITAQGKITGNVIGSNAAGATQNGNGSNGIAVSGATGVQILDNDVQGSGNAGIAISAGSKGTIVQGNEIGTNPQGDPSDNGNAGGGVKIDSSSPANTVGGTNAGDGNRIADNGVAGVIVASNGNSILGNSIEGNAFPTDGIDLGTTGNQLQQPPLLAAARESGHQLNVVGKFLSPGGTYRIEFFLNQTCIDPTKGVGPNEGATFIGSGPLVVNAGGEAAINAFIDISNISPEAGSVVTATATSSSGNTSEFSKSCITIAQGGTATDATLSLAANTQTTTPGASAIPLADIPPTAFGNSTVDANGNTASAPLGSIPLGSIPLGSIPLGSIPLGSIPLGSIGFSAQTLAEDGLGGVPLNSIPLKAPLSWENELQNTSLAGLPIQTLTLRDVLALQPPPANLTTSGPNAIGLKDIDLSLSPLGSIPLGSIALGSAPLGSIPLSGDPTKSASQNVADWCTAIHAIPGFGAFDCSTLGSQTVMGVAIQGVPLGSIPLGSIPLGSIPLGSIPLGSIPLGSIDLADSPLGSIPLGSITLANTPLGSIPLGSINLAGTPLGSIPLGSIPVLSAVCSGPTCVAGGTLGSVSPGDLNPSATLADLGVYGQATLADLAAYLQAHPEIEIKDVVPGLPATTTLRDLLIALMGGTPPSWESFPLSGLQAFAGGAGASGGDVTYSAGFSLTGSGQAIATLNVKPPSGAFYVPGSAVLKDTTANTSTPVNDPIAGSGGLSWTFASLTYGDAYTLAFHLRPGFQLGNEQATATLSTSGVSDRVSSANVTVGDTFESNDTPSVAPAINASTLYISYLGSGKDVDFSTLHIDPSSAPAGTRIKIFLSHLTSDEDLAVFGPGDAPLRSAPLGSIPLGSIAAGDQSVQLGEAGQSLAPDTAQDLPFGALPAGDRLLGVSDNRGTADEEVDITSTGLTGDLLIQVSSYDGHPTTDPYVLRVEEDQPPALPPCTQQPPNGTGQTEATLPTNASIPSTAQTLILFNEKRLGQYYNAADAHTVYTKLQTYAARSDVNGVIVPVEADPGVAAAYANWDHVNGDGTTNLCSPAAANGVVRAIGALLDSLQAGHPNIKNLVIVGAENVIPMARLLDQTQQANELGFRSNFGFVNNEYVGAVAAGDLLSDDPYADPDPQSFLGGFLYVPKLAMGRLVESPQDIARQLDAYNNPNNGLANPQTKFVTGYDFLTDGSQAVESALGRTAPVADQINDTWTADQLRGGVFPATGSGALIDSLNAHYDQHRALSAQGNTLHNESPPYLYTTADVVAHGANAVLGRIIFTMGCHAGFSLFDGLNFGAGLPSDFTTDWPQAYMAGGAIEFMGNTGYGLGDTAAVAYSERLNQLFAQRLDGTMSVGEALEYAKQEYFGDLGVVSLYDAKVGNEATLYGLPTYHLGTGTPPAPPASPPTYTDPLTGLTASDFSVSPTFTIHTPSASIGSYYSANDPNGLGTQVTNRRPIEPLTSFDVTEPGTVAHGVLLTGLVSHNASTSFQAAFSRVTDDQSSIEPQLQGIVDFPASIQSLSTIATPNGQRQRAVLIAGHFASGSAAGVGTQRLYDTLTGTVLYSTSTDFVRPTIRNVQVSQVGSTVGFAADIADLDAAGGAGTIKEAFVLYLDGSGIWQRANLTCVNGRCTGGGPLTGTSVDYIVQAVDAGANVGINANKAATENVTPPSTSGHITVTYSAAPTAGWFTTSPLTATLQSDDGASLSSSLDGGAYRDGASVTISGDGLHTLDARGSDGSTASFLVPIDTLPPTIFIFSPVDGSYLLAGDVVKANYSCFDAGSGLAASGGCVGPVPSGSPIDTTAGNKTFTVNAKDALNNTSSKSVSYQVWPFTGFFQPVDNPPTVNVGKAGSAIPVKFALGGNRGLTFGTFASRKVDCATDAPQDAIETTVTAGSSSLTFDSTSGQYTYVWKTDPSWTGTCRDLTLTFTNGDTRTARFKFK